MTSCPECGARSAGNFCSACGASMGTRDCPSCGGAVPAGSRFCVHCGVPVAQPPSPETPGRGAGVGEGGGGTALTGSAALGWWVAGVLLVGLLVVVAAPNLLGTRGGPNPATAAGGTGAPLGAAPNVDLSSMTPREAADRLWDRVMRAEAAGDFQEVSNFAPMAINAYELAQPLDADGRFHLSVLQRLGQDPEAALETARSVLEQDPGHLLNLAAAAGAAVDLGDHDEASRYWGEFLDRYDGELVRSLEEYQIHAPLLPEMRSEAERYLEGR